MAEQSSMHVNLNWAKERIDEMDAALASLEAKARQAQAESQVNASELIAEMKKRRDTFKATVKKQANASVAAWQATRTQLESEWSGFEAEVRTYFETVGKQLEQQPATFRDLAAAQMKAWREAALSAASAEPRKALDRANQKAGDALAASAKEATPAKP